MTVAIPGDKRRFLARVGEDFTIEPARLTEAEISTSLARAIRQTAMVEDDVFRMTNALVANLKTLLANARAATIAALSKATKDWLANDRRAILDELDRIMATLTSQASLQLQQGQTDAWTKGAELAAAAGVTLSAMPHIDARALAVALQTTPELITNVTQETKDRIATMIRMAALGQVSPLDLMRQMGDVAGKGPWADAFTRGEAIYRTEIGRVFEMANFTRLTDLQTQDPGWMKEWHAVHDSRTRPSHAAADGQRVPINEPFVVGGFKAMYPLDPRLPARESVHCRCIAIAIRPEWAEQGA
jgi:hypothetical protein